MPFRGFRVWGPWVLQGLQRRDGPVETISRASFDVLGRQGLDSAHSRRAP